MKNLRFYNVSFHRNFYVTFYDLWGHIYNVSIPMKFGKDPILNKPYIREKNLKSKNYLMWHSMTSDVILDKKNLRLYKASI